MLPDRWYPILESSKLKRRPLGVRRLGEELVLWRGRDGEPLAAPAFCPHRAASLAGGRVVDGEIACPWHGFRFDASGRCTQMPCEGSEARIPSAMSLSMRTLRESHGLVWLWYGAQRSEYPSLPLFEELRADTRGSAEASYTLPYHYTRMVESNLDMHHVAFVHGRYLPKVARMDPFEAEIEGDHIRTRGVLRREGGKREMPFRAETLLPCLGMIELTPRLRILVSSTPVDDEHTWLWFRYYQDYTKLPGLGFLIAWLAVQSELRLVQPQDWRLFASLAPGTIDDVPYRFVHADKGIALYRKRRAELLARPARAAAG